MIENEKILQAIMGAVNELNEQLPKEERIEKSSDTILFGNESSLDSLGLVSLITTLEQKIEDDFGTSITLLDDPAILDNESSLRTIGSLADFVTSVLEKKASE